MDTIEVNKIIDRVKLAPLQKLVFLFGFLIFFCDGLDTGIIGFIAPSLISDWGITKSELGPVLGVALIGMTFGALSAGPIADRFGRKIVIISATLIFSIFTILCAFASNTNELLIYRLITGIGLGAVMPNISTIVSEYMPIKRKAFLTALTGCGFMLGISSGGILSAILLDNLGWKNVILIGGLIPLTLVIFLIWLLPESTQYLIKNNRQSEAKKILEKIANNKINENVNVILDTKDYSAIKNPIKLLLSKYLIGSILLWICCFMSLLVFYLLTSWMPTILKSIGFNTQQFSLIASLFQIGGVIGGALMGWYMDKRNPTNVVKIAYFLAICLFLIGGLVYSNIWAFTLVIFLLGSLLGGSQGSLLVLAALFYPSTCRSVGVSWMHGIGRTGAILGAFFGSLIFTFNLSLSSLFYILAIPTLIAFSALTIKARTEG